MATVGTIGVGINADPTGLTKGFQRTAGEMKQFERSFASATNRMTGALTMMATHLSIVGKTGPEQLKSVAAAAVSMASVFGPGGQIVSAIALAGTAIFNFHNKAREEAEATRRKYQEMFADLRFEGDFTATSNQVRQFARELFDLSLKAAELKQEIAAAPAAAAPAAGGMGAGGSVGASILAILGPKGQATSELDALNAKIATTKQLLKDFGELATEQARKSWEWHSKIQKQRQKDREDAEAIRKQNQYIEEQIALLDKLNAPTKLQHWLGLEMGAKARPDVAADIRANTQRAQATLDELSQAIRAKAQEWQAIFQQAGRGLANVFGDALVGHIRNFRGFASQIVSIWQNMISQMIAAKLYSQIFGDFFASLAGAAAGGSGLPGAPPPIPDIDVGPPPVVPRAVGATYPVNVTLNLAAVDGVSAARMLEANKGKIAQLVVDAVRTSRQAERDIRGGR